MPDEGKIAQAVDDALRFAGDGADRFVRLLEVLAQLEADPTWTRAEIAAVQSRAIRLMQAAQTVLNLLTRDGMTHVVFEPALSAVQYAKLLEFVNTVATAEELRAIVQAWARAEGLRLSFDE